MSLGVHPAIVGWAFVLLDFAPGLYGRGCSTFCSLSLSEKDGSSDSRGSCIRISGIGSFKGALGLALCVAIQEVAVSR